MKEKTKEIENILNILNAFEFKIKKSLHNTPYQERDDLEQEIKAKIIEKIYSVNFKEPPSFWCFLNEREYTN